MSRKEYVLRDIYDYIHAHNNCVHVDEMMKYISFLSEKYGISRRTIYRYMSSVDWIQRTGFPLSNTEYFIANNEIVQPFKRYGVNIFKYIDAIRNANNKQALIDTVDAMIRYDYEPKGHEENRTALVMLLEAFGFERNGESDRQLYKYILITYHLLSEYVNPFEYLLEDFFNEPIDIEFEIEIIREGW